MIFFSINICSIFPRGVGGNNLAAFSVLLTFVLFLILGHPFPTQQPGLRSCLWPQPYCRSIHVFFSKTAYQLSAGSRLTQPDQNPLNFENDSPLGIESSDKSKAVVIWKTELCTWQRLSN